MSMTLYYIIGIAFLMIVIFISGLTLGKKRSKKKEKYDAYKEALTAIVEGDRELAIELSSKINKRDTIALFMQEFFKLGYKSVSSNEIKLSKQKYKSIIILKR